MNDVSARDLQMQTSQYMAGKALDTFAPLGPGMVLASDIPNPQTLLLDHQGQWAGGTTRQHCQHDLFGGGHYLVSQFPHDAENLGTFLRQARHQG